jgi:AcrR family transcriptional regulator
MEEKNQKCIQIVDSAKSLYWKFGIKKVTVEEICDKANVSKMTFYKHFNNKIELAKYIIQNLFDDGISQYREIMKQDQPYKEKVKHILKMKMDNTNGLSRELLHDLYKNDVPELSELVNSYMQKNLQVILEDFIQAQEQGHIRKNIKPEFIMYMLNKLIDFSTDNQLTVLYKHPQDMVIELTNFFFYGVLSKENS